MSYQSEQAKLTDMGALLYTNVGPRHISVSDKLNLMEATRQSKSRGLSANY